MCAVSFSLSVRQKEKPKLVSLTRHQGEWHVPALKSDFSLWRMWLYKACIFYTVFTKMYVVVKINKLQKKLTVYILISEVKKQSYNTQHPFRVSSEVCAFIGQYWTLAAKTHMTVFSWLHFAAPQPKDLELYSHAFVKKGGVLVLWMYVVHFTK